jgi:hypothetical protein
MERRLKKMPVKFDRQHYNALAKLFRYTIREAESVDLDERNGVVRFAMECTKYFQLGDPLFDPIKFLDQCTPEEDREINNLSELWEEKR